MKLGIVTFHQALNYGAILQTYALQKFINESFPGVEAEVVDYRCPKLSQFYGIGKQSVGSSLKKLIKAVHFWLKKGRFDVFINKNIPIGKEVFGVDTIKDANKIYDKFLVGSDQVWNPDLTNFDTNYLLAFAQTNKRYSYAASVGLSQLPAQVEGVYRDLLNSMEKISVRETSAKRLLEKLGIQSEILVSVDPVLLLPKENWEEICRNVKPRKKGYILVYTVAYSEELIDEAVSFAAERDLDIYYIGQHTNKGTVKYIPYITIDKLLALFRDAQFVFENSFHGTVLSAIFHRRFYAHLPYSDGRNSRITDILKLIELEGRTELENIEKEDNWDEVDKRIAKEQRASHEYLKWVIEHEN